MNYWSFSGILLYWKCISEKRKKRKKLSYRFGPSPWARPACTRSAPRPCGQPARPSPSGRLGHGLHGQGAAAIGLGVRALAPIKGSAEPRAPALGRLPACAEAAPAAGSQHRCPARAGELANRRRWPPISGRLPSSQSQVSTPLRSPWSPLSILHLTQAPSCSELRGFDAPGQVPVREKLLSVFLSGGWR
jgi:hypothetical protein